MNDQLVRTVRDVIDQAISENKMAERLLYSVAVVNRYRGLLEVKWVD